MIDVRTAPYAALVLRLSLGVMFNAHADTVAVKLATSTSVGTITSAASFASGGSARMSSTSPATPSPRPKVVALNRVSLIFVGGNVILAKLGS